MSARCPARRLWIALVLVAGCAAAKTGGVDARVVALFGGEANLAPVLKPAKVEAFRVASARVQAAAGAQKPPTRRTKRRRNRSDRLRSRLARSPWTPSRLRS